MKTTEQVLDYIEELLQKYGAVPNPEENEKMRAALDLRPSFLRNGIYYRVESAVFEEGDIIIITATENPDHAKVGAQDNIAGFSASLPEEKLEKEVRFALEIEPYPPTYPVY